MSGASADRQAPENLPAIVQAHSPVASMVGRFSFKTAFRHPCPVDHRLPHKIVEHFCQIDFSLLHQQGLSYVCLDLDNTLMAQRDEVISPSVVEHLNQARKAGYIKELCLISNVIFRGKRLQRLERIAAELNVIHFYPATFFTRKPTAKPFLWAIDTLGAHPSEMVMVGDQIFADIVGANKMGFHTILVKPIASDHWSTSLTGRRWRELLFLRQYLLSYR